MVFERYLDEAALDHHRQQKPFQELKNSGLVESMDLKMGEVRRICFCRVYVVDGVQEIAGSEA